MSDPKILGKLLDPDIEAMSHRITGKNLDQWSFIFRDRRRVAYQSGHFRAGVMLVQMTEAQQMKAKSDEVNEIDAYCQRYGLADEDLVVVTEVPIAVVVANRRGAGLPFPPVPVRKDKQTKTLNVLMVNPQKHPR